MVSGFHSADVIPVRVAAVGPAVGAAAAAGAAALVVAAGAAAAAGALVAGAAGGWALRLPHASSSGRAASAPPVARLHFKNDRRLCDIPGRLPAVCDGVYLLREWYAPVFAGGQRPPRPTFWNTPSAAAVARCQSPTP